MNLFRPLHSRAAARFIAAPPFFLLLLLAVAGHPAFAGSWNIGAPAYSCQLTPAANGTMTGPNTATGGVGPGVTTKMTGTASISVSWNPGIDLAPAPKCVIVREVISPSASLYNPMGSVTASTDTGLPGNKSVRYSIQTQSSFTVTSPSITAKLTSNGGSSGGYFSFTYSVTLIDVSVSLGGATNDGGVLKVLAGQQLNATLMVGGVATSNSNYSWTITGTVFKDYQSGSQGKVIQLTSADKSSHGINFYTLKDGETIKASCTATYSPPSDGVFVGSNTLMAESKDVTSLKAKLINWTVTPGPVTLGMRTFRLGDLSASTPVPGQTWVARLDAPSPFVSSGGVWTYVQTVWSDVYLKTNKPGTYLPAYYDASQDKFFVLPLKQTALDNVFPYGMADGTQTVSLGSSGTSNDSPGAGWGAVWDGFSVIEVKRSDSPFTTYTMYKPNPVTGYSSTWIPVAYYTWSWGGTWTSMSGYSVGGAVPGPGMYPSPSTLTDNHPKWDVILFNPGGAWLPAP